MTDDEANEIQRLDYSRDLSKRPSLEQRLAAAIHILRVVSYGTMGQLAAQHKMAWAQSVMAQTLSNLWERGK